MKYKIFTFLLVLIASVGTMVAWEYERVQIGDLYYNLDAINQTAEVTYQNETSSNYSGLTTATIPSSVEYDSDTYSVTSIDNKAFRNSSELTSVTIPNCVTIIGGWAFQNCSGLTSPVYNAHVFAYMPTSYSGAYTIPDGIKIIAAGAFSGCSHLTSIEIPNSVTGIGWGAFSECSRLTSIVIPNSVKSIGDYAFNKCFRLTSIEIPNSVTIIEDYAFKGCSSLTSVTIGNSVKSIERGAFESCSRLTSIEIPNSVTSIGSRAFFDCSGLTSVTIGNSVKSIGDYAFELCLRLENVIYPKGLDLSRTSIIISSATNIAYDRNNPPQQLQQQSHPSQPPLLTLLEGTLVFTDATHNDAINATEQCTIRFKIQNNGKSAANNCEARVKLSGSTFGIKVQNIKLPEIAVGQTYEVPIPVTTDINTQDGKVTFSIEVYEPNGWGIAPFDLTVATKAYEPPFLQVVDYNVASTSGKIKKMEPFTLSFNLQNTKYGTAEDVKVKLNLPAGVFVMDDNTELRFTQIKSGEVMQVSYTLIANNNYSTTNIPITIDVKERYGKFAENKQLNIALNQTTSSSIDIAAKDEPQQERKEIQLAMMTSDVDRNIPQTDKKNNNNTFVVIIANENYQQVASVPFALNDGKIFRQYCEQTLGIPAKHIREYPNATGNQIKYSVNLLREKVEEYDQPNIIFYYAGHGIPDEQSKTAYLLPVDGVINDLTTCYKLDDLYTALGELSANHISVFMDACFSGSKREQGMLAEARGVALKARPGQPQGNMVVFSAAQGDETAYPYSTKQHGMFTYYLLKKLQETKGDVTLQQLSEYIIKEVRRQSIEENDKKQTPCVTPSAAVSDSWETWKLK